ncbi:SAV_6107 family HEPN domain-containing protein [Nonomuraea thailandensis]|uniref:SAV_6107 family HEPN domain-containing protein n=2 Tax=Nonomuraea thailandensis TaxID=1188745 RepID=UPI0027E2DC2C|nr:SAV_6107 family HEPN domain-containing protein [Nonomuraea thailandensis]
MVIEPMFVDRLTTGRDRNYVRPSDGGARGSTSPGPGRGPFASPSDSRGQVPGRRVRPRRRRRRVGVSWPDGERGSSSSGLPGGNVGGVCDCWLHRRRSRTPPTTPEEARKMAPRPRDTPGPRLSPAVRAHLTDSRSCLAEATGARTPASRYVAAHLAALRAAAAILAAHPRPTEGRRRRLRSAWELLPEAEPDLAQWASYFADTAAKRAAAEAGMVRRISAADADEILAEAETFVSTVEGILGVPSQPQLPVDVPLAG